MPDQWAQQLLALILSRDLESALQLAILLLGKLVTPRTICILLWDAELQRYIVGDTWVSESSQSAAIVRRQALQISQSFQPDDNFPDAITIDDLTCQRLRFLEQPVGACIYTGSAPALDDDRYQQFLLVLNRTIYNLTYQEIAERERADRLANQTRLEQLLQAVEQQQHTIDQLLAKEKQFSAALESKVAERTAELQVAHQRLIQSEKLAVIGQLSGSLAHEINNPLQAIRSGLGWVLSEVAAGRIDLIHPDLAIILEEVDRMEALFRQMLDFYRPTVFENTPLDLNSICQSAKILIQKRLEQNHARLNLDLEAQLPLTCGDRNQIKQVLLNLLLNAAEALPPHGGHIKVSTASDACWILLQVQDNGAGITPDHQKHLFEPLFTTKTKGLGLGLAISREIVERHHGTIQVESLLAQGSTFSVRLPIRRTCDETYFSGG